MLKSTILTGGNNLPPHCDTLDGPVVTAAKTALERKNVKLILPWAPKEAEEDIKKAFEKVIKVREINPEVKEVVDYWFFETVVRFHRAGEGAPYTGLKPAGLDWGPVVPKAEEAINKEDPTELVEFISKVIKHELQKKFNSAISRKHYDENNVDDAREYVKSMLEFTLYSHHLYKYAEDANIHHKD